VPDPFVPDPFVTDPFVPDPLVPLFEMSLQRRRSRRSEAIPKIKPLDTQVEIAILSLGSGQVLPFWVSRNDICARADSQVHPYRPNIISQKEQNGEHECSPLQLVDFLHKGLLFWDSPMLQCFPKTN